MTITESLCKGSIVTIDNLSTTKKWDKIEVTGHQCNINKWECKTKDISLQMTINTIKMTCLPSKSNTCNRITAKHLCPSILWDMKIKVKKIIWIEEIVEIMINIKILRIDKIDMIKEECIHQTVELNLYLTMKARKYLKCMSITLILKWLQMMLSISSGIVVL